MIERLTVGGFAKRAGMTRQAVYKAIRDGRLTRAPDGLIDVQEGLAQLRDSTHPTQGGDRRAGSAKAVESDGTDGLTFAEARRLHEIEKLRAAKLENDLRERELLPADQVGLWVTSAFARVRSRLLALPSKLAPIAEMRPAGEIEEAARKLIYQALRELSETQTETSVGTMSEERLTSCKRATDARA